MKLSLMMAALLAGCGATGGAQPVDFGNPQNGDLGTAPSATGEPCKRYLSCLLAVHPESYGAAIQLYGDGAACWLTPQQTAGCNQACEASFTNLGGACECAGAQCVKCTAMPFGVYDAPFDADRYMTCSDGDDQSAQGTRLVFDPPTGRTITALLKVGGYPEVIAPKLSGTIACSGPSTLTGSDMQFPGTTYQDLWTVTITPTADTTLQLGVARSTTFTSGFMRTCSLSSPMKR